MSICDLQPKQLIQVRDVTGRWYSATVLETDGKIIKIEREDGEIRKIKDPTAVRMEEEVEVIPPGQYNQEMQDIRVEKFSVTIPLGSNSHRIETEIKSITEQMNQTSLKVNKETWKKNLALKQREVDLLTEECRKVTRNKNFRPNARQDCIEEFIRIRGLPVQKATPTGEPSMDQDTLVVLASMGDELAAKTILAREAISGVSQLKKWEEYANQESVQGHWDQHGTPMGRYTCEGPNLQNRIREIRETIEARPGWKLISWDLGAAEYVTWASLSKDPILTDIFKNGRDVHTEMINILQQAVPNLELHGEEPRQYGKTVNFSILYRMKVFNLAKKLGCSIEVAERIDRAYKQRANRAVVYMEDVLSEARNIGKVSTKFGRTRELPILKIAKQGELHEVEKTAWHHHNCGTAAEILKIKTIRLVKNLTKEKLYPEKVRVAINMHDELIVEAQDEIVEQTKQLGMESFQKEVPGFLPFKIDNRVGQNWLETSK